MPAPVLTFGVRADTSQAEASVKRMGAAVGDMGDKVAGAGAKADPAEAKFLRLAKSLGVETSGAAQKMVSQLQALEQHLIKSNAPTVDLERVSNKLAEAQIRLRESLKTDAMRAQEKAIDDLRAKMTGASGAVDEFGSKFGPASQQASLLGSSLGVVKGIAVGVAGTFGVMAIASTIREWIGASSDFQREFANVKTLFDESKVNAAAMRTEVLSLSGALGSSVDLTKGLYEALSAGIEPANAVKFVGESAMFAKAALVDTRTAVDVLTTTINAYGMKASDANRISDTLFTTIKLGKITGQELSASLGQVIGVAATTGVKFEELNAAIASLTAGGIKGSEAITALRAIISNVGKPTEDASKAADKLGINFSLAGLKSQGLAGFLEELTEKAKGNTQAQVDLFGSVQAFNAIAILTSDQGMKRFNDAMIQIQNSAGATTEAFEKQNATIGAQTEALWNNLTRLFIKAAGEGSSLTTTLKGLNAVLESKTWTEAYLNFNRLTIQWGLMGRAAKQALSDAEDHKTMMDSVERSTKRNFDAMHNYALSLLEAGKAQDKAVGEKTAKQLEEQAKATEKVRAEMDKLTKQYATTTGAALLQIEAIKKDIVFMEQHKGSADALTGAHQKLEKATLDLIVAQSRFPELLKNSTVAHQSTTVAMVGELTAVERLNAGYERHLGTVKAFADLDLDSLMNFTQKPSDGSIR